MPTPFPGMDPYLEHPKLWGAFQHQTLAWRIPDRDRKHPAQAAEAGDALDGVKMRDDFGVAVGPGPPARARELLAQLDVVVDLAVLRDGDRAFVYRDRLMTAGHVDDTQPRRPERRRPLDEVALIIGPTVLQRPHHAGEPLGIRRTPGQREETSDAAHDGDVTEIPATSANSSTTQAATRSAARPS